MTYVKALLALSPQGRTADKNAPFWVGTAMPFSPLPAEKLHARCDPERLTL